MSEVAVPKSPPDAPERAWLTIAERGSVLGIQILFFLCGLIGRRLTRAVLRPVLFYYLLTHRLARRASRRYLERLFPRVTWALMYRHFLRFGEVMLDRIFFMKGQLSHFQTVGNGSDYLTQLQKEKRGAILLGAHFGSVEAMRTLKGASNLPLYIIAYTGNARFLNSFTEKLNPELAGRILEVSPGGIDALLKVKELIDGGNLVAMLGDRIGFNEKAATVDFLGQPARFPTGAYLLSAMCHCPIYLTFGIYSPPNRYEFFCEPFLEAGLELPRGNREEILKVQAQRFATRLEHFCRTAPLNWFNFYDFWAAT